VQLTDSFQDATRPTLIVTGPPRDGTLLALEGPGAEKVLGASPDAQLRLEADNVDAIHARVRWDAVRGVILTDVGSVAGTYVNGERVGAGHVLEDGDRISLGPPGSRASVKLLVRLPKNLNAAAGAAAAPSEGPPIVFDDVGVTPYVAPPPAPAVPVPRPPEPESIPFAPTPFAPATPEPAAPPAPRPLPLVPPPGGERKRPVADYSSDVPSIVSDRVREPGLPMRESPPAGRRGFSLPSLPRPVLIGLATLALAGLAYFAFTRFRQPPPVISSVLPPRAEPGLTVAIAGAGLGGAANAVTVRFGDQRGEVTSASETEISVTVPAALAAKDGVEIPVTVETRSGRSNALFLRVRRVPHPARLEPDVAMPGQEIVLSGDNLDGTPLSVQVGGQPAEVRSVQADAIRLVVPSLPVTDGRSVPVSMRVGSVAGKTLNLIIGRLPLVTELVPSRGTAGEILVVRGRGFDADPADNVLLFGEEPALVLAATPTELKAVVPAAPTTGSQTPVPVVVRAHSGTSSGTASFTLVRPSTSVFVPRFFAAPVSSATDQALVSTLLGPVLLLSDREDAPSVGERAMRVATALNAAFAAPSSRPVTFEAREAPAPAVALAGGEVIVTATAADAAGYSRGPDAAMKGQRATPRSLAAFWAALLQDQFALFVQHQRPSRVLEMSPRGKVLVDLYAEAERRVGSANGVPAVLVDPPAPGQARAFREMALMLPAGPSSAAAAVTGRWEGMMEETGSGERAIKVRLRLDGGRLDGSLVTQAGAIAMEVPLESVSYNKGVLSFVLTSGGSPRSFRGTLQGSTITGTIHRSASDKEAVGRFSLRYAE
jgi:hypothetical protein